MGENTDRKISKYGHFSGSDLIKDLFSRYEEFCRKLPICSLLIVKPLMKWFFFCALRDQHIVAIKAISHLRHKRKRRRKLKCKKKCVWALEHKRRKCVCVQCKISKKLFIFLRLRLRQIWTRNFFTQRTFLNFFE